MVEKEEPAAISEYKHRQRKQERQPEHGFHVMPPGGDDQPHQIGLGQIHPTHDNGSEQGDGLTGGQEYVISEKNVEACRGEQ